MTCSTPQRDSSAQVPFITKGLISDKRQKLIDAVNASELKEGDTVSVRYNAVNGYIDNTREDQSVSCIILNISDKITVRRSDDSVRKDKYKINRNDINGRAIAKVGINPFNDKTSDVRPIAYTLESILFNLNITGRKLEITKPYEIKGVEVKEVNWNPFVYDKNGIKQYYQRPFVWKLQDKQTLIDSIYQGIDCGRILVRKRGFEELKRMQAKGETELYFTDIVDGKQRLQAIATFMNGDYPDSNGNYYGDLSFTSQFKFSNHQLLSYAEMCDDTKDEDVIYQFLKLNFAGVPQSKEHIDFVKSLQSKI